MTSARTYRGTPIRTVRIDDTTWARVTAQAETEQRTAGDIVRDALIAYLAAKQ